MSWHMALDQCFKNNSHLAHIKSLEVTDFIHTLVLQIQLADGKAVYIGKSRLPIYGRLDIARGCLQFICLFIYLFIFVCNLLYYILSLQA